MSSPVYFDDSKLSYKESGRNAAKALPSQAKHYVTGFFPIIKWLPRYNLTWLTGDLIAGLTIGCVVVPQGMAYAKLAALPVQYGLYSSFAGVFLYCFFATSKDITIGPTAVMSLLIGQILTTLATTAPQYSSVTIAATFSLIAGIVTLALGLFRLGFLIEYISGPVVAGFMTGSAITITISQIAGLLGVKNINTRDPAYLVLGNTLAGLPTATLDAAFGLVGLFLLYLFRYGTEFIGRRFPRYERPMFFLGIARSILLVIFSTLIAWGITKDNPTKSPIKLNGSVPSGFQNIGVPTIDSGLLAVVAPSLPSVVLILILEHVAIAKSFGRLNDYVIVPSQELVAIGFSNLIGSFFSAYPATGSFSRTAIKSKAGVRTPIAGVYAGIVVILALYALTGAFFFIPNATLSAIIIHSVADLVSPPRIWKQYWRISPLEFFTFLIGAVVTFFTTVEIGIYSSLGFSLFLLLVRLAHPHFTVLGRVSVSDKKEGNQYLYVPFNESSIITSSPIEQAPPGVVVVRLHDAIVFPNVSSITDKIIDTAKGLTRRGRAIEKRNGDRAWNDDGVVETHKDDLPILKAIVLDLGAVSSLDSTAVQGLTTARITLDRYADRAVEWHFANVVESGVRRSLLAGGFGGSTTQPVGVDNGSVLPVQDIEAVQVSDPVTNGSEKASGPPGKSYFHFDLAHAVQAASAASP
jgi:sodium-independent sulfate anion transporter 11